MPIRISPAMRSERIVRDAYMDRLAFFNKMRNQFSALSAVNPYRGLSPVTCPHMIGGEDMLVPFQGANISSDLVTTEALKLMCDVYTPLYTKVEALLIAGITWDQQHV